MTQKQIRKDFERVLKGKSNFTKCKIINDFIKAEQRNIKRGYQKDYAITKKQFITLSNNTMKVLKSLKDKYCC